MTICDRFFQIKLLLGFKMKSKPIIMSAQISEISLKSQLVRKYAVSFNDILKYFFIYRTILFSSTYLKRIIHILLILLVKFVYKTKERVRRQYFSETFIDL